VAGALSGCAGDKPAEGSRPAANAPAVDPAQADANELGRELYDIMDRVMAYRSSHRNRLPTSLRQAGLDSLTPAYIRRLGRQGSDPLVTIVFRRPDGHVLRSCAGSSLILESSMLHDGTFEVQCDLAAGGSARFQVAR
jgi:hypothetical protein